MIRALSGPPRVPSMQLLYDLLPVLAFFLTYKIAGIYAATAVLIAAVLVQVVVSLVRHRKVSPMLLTSAALVLVFGGLTLLVHDSTFIKWKPTVVNWLFAAAFAGSHLFRGPTLIQRMLGQSVTLSDNDWKQLSLMWIVFFIAAGAANLYVAFNYPEATWVNFKLFGLMGLTLVFVVLQGVWLSRRTEHE
jgi:intracellular septation protein